MIKGYNFEVIGKIRGKERPRFGKNTIYTASNTINCESNIKYSLLKKYPNRTILEGNLRIEILAVFKIPKSATKKEKEQMFEGYIRPHKIDSDNIAKIVLDALNKIAYKDDRQVCELIIKKIYGNEEKLVIEINELQNYNDFIEDCKNI